MAEEKEQARDHKQLGRELDLFTFSDLVGSGLPLWTPRGTLVRNLLDEYVWEMRQARGYEKVDIPHITKKELYETSGHWDKFKDDLFRITSRDGHEFALKPMNCPHHTQIYARKPWSYREMPQRYANSTMCYRDEQTGELNGLSRVRAFTQDDAHVFCREPQIKEEFLKIWDIIEEFYEAFGFSLKIRLSFHDPKQPEKYLGDKHKWQIAEETLRAMTEERNVEISEGIGEAAFYGPKLDFMATDSLGREWQVATIQLDMNMPDRFDLTCVNEKGERERIVMIHAAIMGSIERFMAVLLEHLEGMLPLWLAPLQVVVLPVSEKHQVYAEEVVRGLREAGIRSEISADDSLGKRIRQLKLEMVPYYIVVGDSEMQAQTVTIENRSGQKKTEALQVFIEKLKRDIASRAA
ncbi:threonine--tRNA ligase [Candidatus Kaiserbacteria bacterium]|nr:threonine--tRNA ligase [Candidatus Kaiserbacteria bacterium]